MSSSDEEEFLSADEDNFDQSDDERDRIEAFVLECDSNDKPKDKTPTSHSKSFETRIQEAVKRESKSNSSLSDISNQPQKLEHIPTKDSGESIQEEDDKNSEQDREKNLKIARKFSAEIAKSVQASAPATVKSTPPIEINEPNSIQTNDLNEGCSKSGLPPAPAPPPTPALSSSYSNTDHQPPSQFNWRVLPKSKQLQKKNPKKCELEGSNSSLSGTSTGEKQELGGSKPTIEPDVSSSIEQQESKTTSQPRGPESSQGEREAIEQTKEIGKNRSGKVDGQPQARFALDRLSESVSQSGSQNIFEKVFDDLKRVSIGTNQDETIVPPTLPSITDIGARLGNWGWGGVQTDWLMASASQVTSQVTSQVGSVLESVVNVAQQTVQQPQDSPATSNFSEKKLSERKNKDD